MTVLSSTWLGRRTGAWRVSSLARSAAQTMTDVLRARRFDLNLLQRWIFTSVPTFEMLTRHPRVLDVDDAIWLERKCSWTKHYVKSCDGVICGNQFIADFLSSWNPSVSVIPTAVDCTRFKRGPALDYPVICWTGSRSTLKYLMGIERPLSIVLERHRDARLRIICDVEPEMPLIRREQVEFVPWSPTTEGTAIWGARVGIMPLDASDWSKSKCSYKMLCYMACGLAVVASPVGMNADLLRMGSCGLPAQSDDEWVEGVDWVIRNVAQARSMGNVGRRLVLEHFDVPIISRAVADVLATFGAGAAGTIKTDGRETRMTGECRAPAVGRGVICPGRTS